MHSKALVLANLPEDPAPTAGLKTVLIQKGDYRKGLVPNKVIDRPSDNACKPGIGTIIHLLRPIQITCMLASVSAKSHAVCQASVFGVGVHAYKSMYA